MARRPVTFRESWELCAHGDYGPSGLGFLQQGVGMFFIAAWYSVVGMPDLPPQHNVVRGPKGSPYSCPCCGYATLPSRGDFELCDVCFWEDDGQDDEDADIVRLGPNGGLSLTQARANYREYGACSPDFRKNVRSPKPDELPPHATNA